MLSWRYRRILLAEAAEIRKSMDLADPDLTRLLDGEELSGLVGEPLFGKIANPRITVLCLRFVNELLTKIEYANLAKSFASRVVTVVYGKHESLTSALNRYFHALVVGHSSASEDINPGSTELKGCKEALVNLIHEELRTLLAIRYQQMRADVSRIEIEWGRANVPEATQIDRLLRYQTTLERDFDRTLGQLERQQQLRRGQRVAPTLNVRLST
jgi:hypothetical protein